MGSSMDVFSEGIELFNKRYPILFTAYRFAPVKDVYRYNNAVLPHFFPECYTYRMYAMSPLAGFNTGRRLLESLAPHKERGSPDGWSLELQRATVCIHRQ